MENKNIFNYIALLCIYVNISNAHKEHHRDHKNKREYFTSDGIVYNEVVVTSTLPPVTYYSTSYWTSYWTSVITQYSTIVYNDFTSTKTLVTPTTYQVVASSSFSTTTAAASTSSQSQSSSSLSLINDFDVDSVTAAQSTNSYNVTTLFSEVSSPFYMTTVNNDKTTIYFIEDVWYNSDGSATSTNYEQYIGTDSTIPLVDTTFFSTSTTTIKKTVTITTST
ncbi:hypothetical protein QEN19_002275 [Hanseniaspora menglaensis]